MTIQTGRDKRRGARPGLMTGDRRNGLTQRDSKDVPQFAPNFTVYVLPPDVVCLYSEDRKFFLHGELYCALASAIGGRQELSGARSRAGAEFSVRQDPRSPEAARRPPLCRPGIALFRRRTRPPIGRASACRRRPRRANLQKCRVRIQSIDVQGATELGAALKALGVRVVKRAADLTVTLVNDYLEGRLAELNRQHLSDRTPWLLVQPSGIFPLVGPVFSPGGQERLLDLSRRSDETQPRDQGASSTADRPAASRLRRSPATCSDRAPSSLRPSRSRKRSPPTFAPTCAITSSASTCWARPS